MFDFQMLAAGSGNNSNKEKEHFSDDQLFEQLNTKLSFLKRLLLRYLSLPLCRRAVGLREQSKYFMIWMYSKYREAFWELARMMVKEGRIPDEETLFFLTIEEIQQLLRERNSTLLMKARLRKRYYPKMDKFKFSEIFKGYAIQPRNVCLKACLRSI